MALIKFGGGVTQASGSIGGTTFARNRYGNYMRARTKPVNPNTQKQADIRACISQLSNVWSSALSVVERGAWNTYAAAIAMKNRLGESMYLTGFNHFIRSNTEWLNQGHVVTEAGPTTLLLPAKDTTIAFSGTADDQKISVTFDATRGWAASSAGVMYIYQGQPRNVTRNFFAGPWKYTGKIEGASTPPTSPTLLTAAFTLTLDQLVTCYARIRETDGRLSEPMVGTFTVAAT